MFVVFVPWNPCLSLSNFQKSIILIIDRYLRYDPDPRRGARSRREAARHHSKHHVARRARRFLDRDDHLREK